MTDSTTNRPGDSGLDVGASTDELFGDLEETDTGAGRTERGDGDEGDGDEPDEVEDRTAAEVFDQLRADAADEGDTDDVLADETPDDIIASASEPDPDPVTPVDDDLLADEDELTELLLTGRTKDGEFLWVDTADSDDRRDAEPDESAPPATAESDSDGAETPIAETQTDPQTATTTAGTGDEPSDGDPTLEHGTDASAVDGPDTADRDTDADGSDLDATETESAADDDAAGLLGRVRSLFG
ncbi:MULTISPECIES: hypothetical protein [unclassified Natrinema]|uniref:hypothetical protein n=1 Tax=unclassified Natrinema TaxID=2622230 RepID=UPI00026D52C3|nr:MULTISPECIES: hypothetical protein [unclassified Natrinema]AFO56069.1 hypothetical protein NJ7G_0820 [Natrinema sp. J7-2]